MGDRGGVAERRPTLIEFDHYVSPLSLSLPGKKKLPNRTGPRNWCYQDEKWQKLGHIWAVRSEIDAPVTQKNIFFLPSATSYRTPFCATRPSFTNVAASRTRSQARERGERGHAWRLLIWVSLAASCSARLKTPARQRAAQRAKRRACETRRHERPWDQWVKRRVEEDHISRRAAMHSFGFQLSQLISLFLGRFERTGKWTYCR